MMWHILSSGGKVLGRFFSSLFRSMALLVNVLDLILLSVALLAPYLSPNVFSFPAYLGLLFPLFLILHAVVTLYAVVRRRWIRTFFNILMWVIAYPSVNLYHPFKGQSLEQVVEVDSTNTSLRILTLNAHAFLYQKFSSDGWHPSLEFLSGSGADVICLQEAVLSSDGSSYVSLKALRKKLPEYKYVDATLSQEGQGSRLVLLSKFPIVSAQRLPIDSEQYGAMHYLLDVDKEQPLSLFHVHLESFRITGGDTEDYVSLARGGEPKKLSEKVYTKLSPSFQRRALQVDALHQMIKKQSTPYVVVCGDFNDTPLSYAHGKLSSGMIDAFEHSGKGFGFSFSVRGIGVRIDHILHSPAIESYDCRVIPDLGISDHNPIICDLLLKESNTEE